MGYFDHTDLTEPTFTIRVGMDGAQYAVFRDEFALYDYERIYPGKFRGCEIASFGRHDNAYRLSLHHSKCD